jgi:hypothetical protein
MEAMETRPGASAVAMFPEAASANRSIFYRNGRPATVAEVHANLQSTAGGAAPVVGPSTSGPVLDEREMAIAARMDRLKQDQSLLSLLLGQDGDGKGSGFGGAFGPGPKSSSNGTW